MNKPVTKQQIAKIYTLLNQQNLKEFKENIVFGFTDHRTTSVKEMSIEEAKILIQSLVETDRCEPLRKKVLAIAYDVGIIWGDTIEDKQMNMVKINQFLINRGTIKKQLHKLSYEELIKTVKQFESIRRNNAYSEAGKQVKNLLTELNITTL